MSIMTHTSTIFPPIETPEHQSLILASKRQSCIERLSAQEEVPGYCPGKWDGILCWDRTPPGQFSVQTCPEYVAGFRRTANATRQCLADGSWFIHDQYLKEWTNYSQCSSGPEATVLIHFPGSGNGTLIENYIPALKIISQVGYGVSLASLTVAFCILASIKKLRCPRNMLHMHLFVSFIMRAFMALLKNSLFVMGIGLSSDILVKSEGTYFNSEEVENWECKLITTLWQYFIMANYSWILMEGLYLHNLIFLALFTDSSAITLYVVLGWGLPTLFVIPWAVCRSWFENTLCWTTNENSSLFLLIRVPTTTSIVMNFILFVNIVRVLLSKLRSSICEESKTYRRWAKSTLVLVPLFGVHYMLFLGLSYSMGVNEAVELAWLFCDQLFASFQGFFVAVLYCFLNGEVRSELAKKKGCYSCSELLNSLPLSGGKRMSNDNLSMNHSRARDRSKNPRASCYSSTSFTTVSVVPNSNCCLNKKRASAVIGRAAVYGSRHGSLEDVKQHSPEKDTIGNGLASLPGQARRGPRSDCHDNNEIELQRMSESTQ
ncbi:secretin receptor-like [Anabrus simplex]|uniref:secretin receptor-like n=1 Tax=Anabrus simplex TaxID=316456 RepID=UPI0035A39045